jgi:hypothetical protein
MSLSKTTTFVFLLTIGLVSFGQGGETGENSDEPKVLKAITPFQYIDANASSLKLRKRTYDSPFFCDEIIEYKSGYIINSISSYSGSRQIGFSTRFYFYDPTDKSISRILISKADTIEAIVSSGKALYYSYIKGGKRQIEQCSDNQVQNLLDKATSDIRKHIDTSRWIKLGLENGKLFTMSPNSLFVYNGDIWEHLVTYDLDNFCSNKTNYRESISLLPTKNLLIRDTSVYFLQEVVQDRTCDLVRLNISNGVLEDYFDALDYRDSYYKQVNDFTVLTEGSLLVSSSRLIGSNMLINSKNGNASVWIFNNTITDLNGRSIEVPVTTVLDMGDTLLLASDKGLFLKYSGIIQPLVYFENAHQTIKRKSELIDFPFKPRSIIKVKDNNYLIGGMWGGLYQVDILNKNLTCLDDIGYGKIKTVDVCNL